MPNPDPPARRRNRAFEATHEALIETAVGLVAQRGIASLSLSELARAAQVNRATIYYHFASREALIDAMRDWSVEQLVRAFAPFATQDERARYIARFAMENPDVMALWIADFLAPGDIRTRYPRWDSLVEGMAKILAADPETADADAEVYCVNVLVTAMLGTVVYRNSVRPDLPAEEAITRIAREQVRRLRADGIPG